MTRNKALKTGSGMDDTTPTSKNAPTRLVARSSNDCEDWLQTLARANGEAGSVPTRETIEDIWRGLRWTIGYEEGTDK